MLEVMKKLGLSLVVVSALSVSANAACEADYCETVEMGIGGLYTDLSGTNANVMSYGGYGKFGGDLLYKKRLYLGADIKLGGGQNSLSGSSIVTLNAKNPFFWFGGDISLGVNILTPNAPLIVSAFIGSDGMNSKSGLSSHFIYTGAQLSGRIPIGKLSILYGAGYGWVFSSRYNYNQSDVNANINGYNYMIKASLGLAYSVTEKTEMYVKAIGKYYNLNAANTVENVSFPAANQFMAMLEIGFRHATGYTKSF